MNKVLSEILNKIDGIKTNIIQYQNTIKGETYFNQALDSLNEIKQFISGYNISPHETSTEENTLLFLKQSEAIFSNIQVGIYIYLLEDLSDDSSLRMINANPESEKMTGVKVTGLIGKRIDECFPGLRERNIPFYYAEVVRNQNPLEIGEFFYDRDGVNPKYYSVKAFPLPGNHVGVFFDDITTLKNTMKAVEESEIKYRQLTESLEDFIFSLDLDLKFTYISPAGKKILGYEPDEFYNMKIWHLMPASAKEILIERFKERKSEWEQGINIKQGSRFQYQLLKKDNSLIWVEVNATAIYDTDNNIIGYNGIGRDITERKKYEEELRIAKEKAEESDRLKSAFLANMSHEIRTPMNGILGFAAMLNRDDLPKERRSKYIDYINSSTNQLLTIINDIIDISRIEAGQLKIYMSETGLSKLVDEVFENIETVRQQKKKHGISLELVIPENKDLMIKTDEVRLKQILTNLLNNALKFTSDGQVRFGYELIDNSEIRFFVTDTGKGIASKYKEKIFDRFCQGDEISDPRFGGTGLGLAISKGIAELLGGKIWYTSEIDVGSEFYLGIPYEPAEKKKSKKKKELTEKKENWSDKRILVVEDDKLSNEYIKELLKHTKARVDFVHTGEEAIERCNQFSNYDAVLMDLRLPEMDGYETTKKIKEINKEIPVIVQTANVLPEQKEKAYQSGCDTFLAKPMDKKLFFRALKSYLR